LRVCAVAREGRGGGAVLAGKERAHGDKSDLDQKITQTG
jgi:hypothetical protein